MNRRSFMAGVLALLAPRQDFDWSVRRVFKVNVPAGSFRFPPGVYECGYLKGCPVAGTRWEK